MIKTILIPAAGSEDDALGFETALAAGKAFQSHLQFLHVSIDPIEVVATSLAMVEAGGGAVAAGWIDTLEDDVRSQAERARNHVEEFCRTQGIALDPNVVPNDMTASWHREKGHETKWIPTYAREADLAVIGRSSVAAGVLAAALFESGRPILVPASGGRMTGLETAVIAWKPTREAARAVAGAMPLIETCKRAVIVVVDEGNAEAGPSAQRLAANLRRTEAAVTVKVVSSNGGDAVGGVLGVAHEFPRSFLVMGGYGHNRLREMVFGGFTQSVLDGADLPVLIAH